MSDFLPGALVDPTQFQDPIDIGSRTTEDLVGYLQSMLRIRKVEQKLAVMRRDGVIGGPVHLGVGQEAVAVGVSAHLRKSDRVFGAHRSHSHLLALGSSIRGLFAEVLGKDTGLSRGMGGSMHLWDQPNGFFGSVPIVSGTVPLAVGAGLAAKLRRESDVAVAYFGDGAVEEGSVHESLNLASVMKLPVIFVVENNLFSSHMHISLRQPSDAVSRFAVAHSIPYELLDGNDVVAVAAAAERLIDSARAGGGPGLLEAVTFRWYGHVDWREDIDVGVNRSTSDLGNWRKRDPVARLRQALEKFRAWHPNDFSKINNMLDAEVDAAWQQAESDPYPKHAALLDRVYGAGKS